MTGSFGLYFDVSSRDFAAPSLCGGFGDGCRAVQSVADGPLRAEGVSKLGGNVCLRVIFRSATHSGVIYSFRAGGGPISVTRRSAAPGSGTAEP